MSYSNWGAEVWCDQQARLEQCDATIPQMLRLHPSVLAAWDRFARPYFDDERSSHWPHHAIVGDALSGVIIGLYKSSPAIYALVNDEWRAVHDPATQAIPALKQDEADIYNQDTPLTFNVEGLSVTLHIAGKSDDTERIAVYFKDRQGREWFGVAGYQLGVGFDHDWPQRAWPSRWWQARYASNS